jgi:hypothetical protein
LYTVFKLFEVVTFPLYCVIIAVWSPAPNHASAEHQQVIKTHSIGFIHLIYTSVTRSLASQHPSANLIPTHKPPSFPGRIVRRYLITNLKDVPLIKIQAEPSYDILISRRTFPLPMAAVHSEDEILSEQYIARLLDEQGPLAVAEALQLHFALQDSAQKGKGRAGQHVDAAPLDQDFHVAVNTTADPAWAVADSSVTPHVHSRESAQTSTDQQYAMKLADAEIRARLDIEFAKALQRMEDEGVGDIADASMQDVEAVLGNEMVQRIMVRYMLIMRSGYH